MKTTWNSILQRGVDALELSTNQSQLTQSNHWTNQILGELPASLLGMTGKPFYNFTQHNMWLTKPLNGH